MLRSLLQGTGLPKLTFNAVQGLEMTAEVGRDEWLPAALVVLARLVSVLQEASVAAQN